MYDKFVSSFLKETQWTYTSEMYEVSGPTTAIKVDFFKYLLVSMM